MKQNTAFRPAKLRIRPLTVEARQRRAALHPRVRAPGQIYTDWAAI